MTHSSAKHFSMILIIILGVMTAFGPLTIDTYTPSLPKVQHDFGTTTSEIQLTLSFAMIDSRLGNSYLDLFQMSLVKTNCHDIDDDIFSSHFFIYIYRSLNVIFNSTIDARFNKWRCYRHRQSVCWR